jgi:hypothetical protein
VKIRSANEWRDFWRERGERELASLLDEFDAHATRIATLLGSRASLGAPDAARDAEVAHRIHAWFARA